MAAVPTRAELKQNLKVLRDRLSDRPMDLDARMRMARTYRLLGSKKQSLAHYRQVARYLSLAGHPLQAIAVLKELLQVEPKDQETLLFLAKLYARTRAADPTNTGRVAVPILDSDPGPLAMPDGLPLTTTGIWRAIRPQRTDLFAPGKAPLPEKGLSHGISVDAIDLRESGSNDPDAVEISLNDANVLEVQELDPRAHSHSDATEGSDEFAEKGDELPDISEQFAHLGSSVAGQNILPRVPLFSMLSPEAFIDLSHAMVFHRVKPENPIFREGERGDSFVVIARGRAQVTREVDGKKVEVAQLKEGDVAGVFALLAARNRQANVVALTPVEYFEIDRLAVDKLVITHPKMKEVIARFFRERLLLNLLAVFPIFEALDVRARQAMINGFVQRVYEADTALFAEKSMENGFWMVLNGTVEVRKKSRLGEDEVVATLGAGDYIGTLIGKEKGGAGLSAIATRETTTAVLSQPAFEQLMSHHADPEALRRAIHDHGLMVAPRVFGGSARVPGKLARLDEVFARDKQ
jgi:CRP-like cAMP-binding protein